MPWVKRPKWCSYPAHPCEYLIDAMEDASHEERANALGISRERLFAFMDGEFGVTPEFADRLERATGIPASEWARYQRKFESQLANNDAMWEAGYTTVVYKMEDEDGNPVLYGLTEDPDSAYEYHLKQGQGPYIEELTQRLFPSDAQRRLDKLVRAFQNRKKRERDQQRAATLASGMATPANV